MDNKDILDFKYKPETISLKEALDYYKKGMCDSKMIADHVAFIVKYISDKEIKERILQKELVIKGLRKQIEDSNKPSECRNCGEMVNLISLGEMCPECKC